MESQESIFDPVDLLNELSLGEDEFDVDLMACGCRLACSGTGLHISIDDMVRLYEMDIPAMTLFVGALIDEAKIEPKEVFSLAYTAAKRDLKSPPRVGKKKKN